MKSALSAFKRTTNCFGLTAPRLFFTDNPSADHKFYLEQLPSLARQQKEFDNLSAVSEPTSALPDYDFRKLKIKVVQHATETNDAVNAMMELMVGSRIGLDAEWEIIRGTAGRQVGRSKVNTIQIAYRDTNNDVTVIVVRTERMTSLPHRLKSLLVGSSIKIAGNKVSADLIKIGADFDVAEIKSVDQKSRANVFKL